MTNPEQLLPERPWLRFDFGKGAACPALAWGNVIRRAVEDSANAKGFAVTAIGGLPSNVADVCFGDINKVQAAIYYSQASSMKIVKDIDEQDPFCKAYSEIANRPGVANLGLVVIKRCMDDTTSISWYGSHHPNNSTNMETHISTILKQNEVDVTTYSLSAV